MTNISEIQAALIAEGLDAWLFFDHHRRDPLAYRILRLASDLQPTRRWYYFIPAHGEPRKLVHRIEPHMLDSLPGQQSAYSTWSEQRSEIEKLLTGAHNIAMQFSALCAIPYVAMVDGGTLDLIRSCGVFIETSANLVQIFEACWTDAQLESHLRAGSKMDHIRAESFDMIRERLGSRSVLTEWEVRNFIHSRFAEESLITDHGPVVAVNANASDPHYEPSSDKHSEICFGDLVLIDMWAKLNESDSVYYDITWTGYCGHQPPDQIQNVFDVVTRARDEGIEIVRTRAHSGLHGFEVDDAVRTFIVGSGYGDAFIHRTGHSIGINVHGSGANMDNFETHDDRRILPRTCFSIEPGIYLPNFGIRSEVNVYVGVDEVRVTGEIQRQLVFLN